jgi:hypothetical protein
MHAKSVLRAVWLDNFVSIILACTMSKEMPQERALVTGNEIPRIVAHGCVIEVSIGKHIESHSTGLKVTIELSSSETT